MESMYHLRRIHFQAYITGSKTGTTAATEKSGGGVKGGGRQSSIDDSELQLLINDGIEPSRNPKCKSTLILLDKVTKIGRNPELVDVVLNSVMHSNMISRDHSEILGEADADGKRFICYKIFDHSLNGTYVNDTRVNGPVVLREGDIIKFGHVNGAAIKPGEHAGAQQSAEFIFIFERALGGQHYFGYSSQGARLHSEKGRAYMQIYSDRVTPQETFATTPSAAPPMIQHQPTLPTAAITTTSATTTTAATAAAMRLLPQPIPTSMSAVLGQALTTAAAVLGQPTVGLPITASATIPASLSAMVNKPVMGAPPQQTAPAATAPQHTTLTLTPDDISAHLRSMVAADTLSSWNASLLQLTRLQQQNPHLYGSAFPAAAAAAAAYFQSASNNPNYAAAALWPQANIAAQWRAALQQQQQQQQPAVTVATSVAAAQEWQAQLNQAQHQHQQKMAAAAQRSTPLPTPLPFMSPVMDNHSQQHQQLLSASAASMGGCGAVRLQAPTPHSCQQPHAANSGNMNHHNTSALSSLAAVAANASASVGGGVITSSLVSNAVGGQVAYSSCTSSASGNSLASAMLHPSSGQCGGGQHASVTAGNGGTSDSMMMARLAAHLQQQQLPSALMASMLAQQQQQLSASSMSNGPLPVNSMGQPHQPTAANPTQLTYSSSLAGEKTPAATTINSLAAAIFDNGQIRESEISAAATTTMRTASQPAGRGSRGAGTQQRQAGRAPLAKKAGNESRLSHPTSHQLPSAEEEEMKAVESIRGEQLLNGGSGGASSNIMRTANDLRQMQIANSSADIITSPPAIAVAVNAMKPPLNMNSVNCGGLSIAVSSGSNNLSGNNSHHGSAGDSTMHSPVLSNPSRPCSYQSIPQSPPRAPCPEPRRSPSDSPLRDSDDNWLQLKPPANNNGNSGGGSGDGKFTKHPSSSLSSGGELAKSDSATAVQVNGNDDGEGKAKPIKQGRKSNEVARLLNDLTAGNCNNRGVTHADSSASNEVVEWSWRRAAASLAAANWGPTNNGTRNNDDSIGKNRKVVGRKTLARRWKTGGAGSKIALMSASLGSWQHQAQRSNVKRTPTVGGGGDGAQTNGSSTGAGRDESGTVDGGGATDGISAGGNLDLYKKKRTLRLEERKLKEMAKKKAHKMMRQISDESSDEDDSAGGNGTVNSLPHPRPDASSSDEDGDGESPSSKYLSSSSPPRMLVAKGIRSRHPRVTRKKATPNEEKKKSSSQVGATRKRKPAAPRSDAKTGGTTGGGSDSDDSDRSLSSLNSAAAAAAAADDDTMPPAAKRSSNGSSSKHNSSSLNSSGQSTKRAPKQKRKQRVGMQKGEDRPLRGPLTPPGDASSCDGRPEDWTFHDPDKDLCAHKRCQRPQELAINWVQCDDCDEWYHSICALGSNSDLEAEADFHCGCAATVAAASTTVIVASGRKR